MRTKVISTFLITVILFNVFCFSSSAESAKVYYKSQSSAKKIALTFDDGPHPRITRQVLEILDEYGIKATFFVIGQNVKNYPETMKLLAESGCEIGNHTFSHKSLKNMNSDQIKKEIEDCQKILSDNFSVESTLLRPPQGMFSDALKEISAELDYDIILWSIDTLDWAHTPYSDISKKVLSNVKNGDIILMHDYISGDNQNCKALRLIIPELLEQGYEFVTVSELIRDEI